MSSEVDIWSHLFIFFQFEGIGSRSEAEKILLQIVGENSDIELSDDDQDLLFEGEAEESESSEDEDEVEEEESVSSRCPLWSKTTVYILILYSLSIMYFTMYFIYLVHSNHFAKKKNYSE
ncbi:hypothetical protein NL108_013585 [Boleophthalmus pectinirostris]|nr:hypothetical protein NL108_013585 [Boleophthalmus pectinirostris]